MALRHLFKTVVSAPEDPVKTRLFLESMCLGEPFDKLIEIATTHIHNAGSGGSGGSGDISGRRSHRRRSHRRRSHRRRSHRRRSTEMITITRGRRRKSSASRSLRRMDQGQKTRSRHI